ncbi:MAG: hypothetical protein COA66_13695 [Arcobacter sp.]|nr:MAG: hypothetical protein COA66_13695 [Arcobacter sp.]
MNIPLIKIRNFKNFIDASSSLKEEEGNNIYLIITAIESYYEFVSESLIHGTSRSKTQFKLLQELEATKVITFDEFKIMDETRKLKNDLTHRLDFLPDLNTYHNFNNNCKIENIQKPSDEKDQAAVLKALTYSLVSAYKSIDKKLFPLVEKELS